MVQFGTFKVPGAKNGPKNAKIGQKRPKMGMDKIFQGAKIEIFGPAHMPTGIKGATDQMLP